MNQGTRGEDRTDNGVYMTTKIFGENPGVGQPAVVGTSSRRSLDRQIYLETVRLFFLDPNSPCMKMIGSSWRCLSDLGGSWWSKASISRSDAAVEE